ncbi:hypothetical protein SASPL_141818 [Salvia splendens]|uniref:DC1 domain-containing protein n=1 Tax=Salvia splendens TaxID=180675 RepID=A0A8X8WKH9_SALSN|nr:hypothetical protein SASPL_141818 [Salvia splendens]
MPQLRHVMTYEGTLDAAYGLNGDMNGQDGVFVLEHLQSLFVMSNLNFGEGLWFNHDLLHIALHISHSNFLLITYTQILHCFCGYRHSIMEKKVIDRFYHEHPLILIENVSNDETPNCYGCGIPVNDLEVAYVCTVQNCSNRIILHKKCGELPSQILHPKHPEHPLYLFDYHRSLGLWCDMCTCDLGKMLGCVASTTTEIADEDSNLGGDDDGFDVVEFPLHARDISKELITPFVMREKGLNNIPDVAVMPATVKMPETTARFSFLFNYHNHPLSLVSELPHKDDEVDHNDIMDARGEDDVLKICDVCVTPISSPPYYACAATACITKYLEWSTDSKVVGLKCLHNSHIITSLPTFSGDKGAGEVNLCTIAKHILVCNAAYTHAQIMFDEMLDRNDVAYTVCGNIKKSGIGYGFAT